MFTSTAETEPLISKGLALDLSYKTIKPTKITIRLLSIPNLQTRNAKMDEFYPAISI